MKTSFKYRSLSRKELRAVLGGDFASCVASCGGGKTVLCQGTNCIAEDNVGCSSDQQNEPCNPTDVLPIG
ncbi:hypothetical protein [Ascidiimonas aurantiaca]|uniref:hypothetical protein n=1 Tax=Ascidiimonas aurantiaca TaxID=1685432 RepID=UPI0030EDAC9B